MVAVSSNSSESPDKLPDMYGANSPNSSASSVKPLNCQTRHGFEDSYENYKEHLKHFYLYYRGKKYSNNFHPVTEAEKRLKGEYYDFVDDWKNSKNRILTSQGGIFVCLKISIDPPQGRDGKPYATSEAWLEPKSFRNPQEGVNTIVDTLIKQYKTFAMKATLKGYPDVVMSDLKRSLSMWRKNNKETGNNNRYLFHYNGHGVPDATSMGELWGFNQDYTQYVPMSVGEIQDLIGGPAVMVYDCNKAGYLLEKFKSAAKMKMEQQQELKRKLKLAQASASSMEAFTARLSAAEQASMYNMEDNSYLAECYQFAACKYNELLPTAPELPADLFTSCMTTPIEMSIRFFMLRNTQTKEQYKDLFARDLFSIGPDFKYKDNKVADFDSSYFKRSADRKDQIADLSYIYTSITDTIAYTTVPKSIFKKCFRQDTTCSNLFRNFLLAQRIMKFYNRTPQCSPELPDCSDNELWNHWDLAVEHFLTSLVQMKSLDPEKSLSNAIVHSPRYVFSNFFDTSLDHFKNWIQNGHFTMVPPPQLSMTLQLLLTPKYRARALKMLSFFVDLGPWAVSLALQVGVYPYVLKLLQSPVIQLKPLLTFVWAKLLACDYKNMQYDLSIANGGSFKYFYYMLLPQKEVLSDIQVNHKNAYFESIDKQAKEQKKLEAKIGRPALSLFKNDGVTDDFETKFHKQIDFKNEVGLTNDHFTVALVVLTLFIKDHDNGRDKLLDQDLLLRVTQLIDDKDTESHPQLQLWSALYLSQAWNNSPGAKLLGFQLGIVARLVKIFNSEKSGSDLRAAIVYCFTTFLTVCENREKLTSELEHMEHTLAATIIKDLYDSSVAVRKEMAVFLSKFVYKNLHFFCIAAFSSVQEEIVILEAHEEIFEFRRKSAIYGTVYSTIWRAVLILACDPHDEVQNMAEQIIIAVLNELKELPSLKEPYLYCYNYLVQKVVSDEPSIPLSFSPSLTSLREKAEIEKARNGQHSRQSSSSVSRFGRSFTEPLKRDAGSAVHRTTSISGFIKNVLINESPAKQQATEKHFEKDSSLPHPLPPRYEPFDLSRKRPELPLKSRLLEFFTEYYQYPQLHPFPDGNPMIDEYDPKLAKWRKSRNDTLIAETQAEKYLSVQGDWSHMVNRLELDAPCRMFEFAQFEDYLVSSNGNDEIRVWDYEKNETLNRFSNNNPYGSKITQLQFMNEDDAPILIVGSNDGTVKLYKKFDDINSCRVVSAWQTLQNVVSFQNGTNFLFDWQQARGDLFVTGNIKTINVWNALREKCYLCIAKRSSSLITSLTCDQLEGNIVVAGFSNGDLRAYDKRCGPRKEMIGQWQGNRSGVNNVHMQRGGYRELVSGFNNGAVKLWDVRMPEPVESFQTVKHLRTIKVHEHSPVFVTGSESVKVWTTSGDVVCDFYNKGTVGNVALHPHRMMLAVGGSTDPGINVYRSML